LPRQSDIELPLLLELERSGGLVRRPSDLSQFYDRIARHFPDMDPDDRTVTRRNGKTLAFDNSVECSRNSLREKGQLDGDQRGVWGITAEGRRRLRIDLANLGIADVHSFIITDKSRREAAGPNWAPRSQRARSHGRFLSPAVGGLNDPSIAPQPIGDATVTLPPSVEVASRQEEDPGDVPFQDELLTRLRSLSSSQFELLIGAYLQAKGLSNVNATGRTGDGGIDGEAELPFLDLRCAFQAKRYSEGNHVGSAPVRNFKGGVLGRYDRGILITTSTFTAGAKEEADQPGVTIILVDGGNLVSQMLELGLGVKTIPVVERSIDEEFFSFLSQQSTSAPR
jgi:restriction endonuclease Mrr